MMNNKILSGVLVLLVLVSVGLLLFAMGVFSDEPPARVSRTPRSTRAAETEEATPVAATTSATQTVKSLGKPKKGGPKTKPRKRRKVFQPVVYSAEDQRLVDRVQEASDTDDFGQVREAALAAMKSPTPDVREEALDALAWFGEKALIDLTKAMRDPHPDVAEAARGHVEQALMGIDDNERAAAFSFEYLKSFINDSEARTMFSGVFTSAASQLIDPDDADSAADVAKAKSYRRGIVDNLVSLMGEKATPDAIKEAKEMYEIISGEDWTTRDAALKWADDIDEPEVPEAEDHASDEDATDDSAQEEDSHD